MINSKKGIMFTVLAVLISAIVLASFFSFKSLPLDANVENTKIRIQSINRYTIQTDDYVTALTRRATDKTLKFTIDVMIGNNSFLGNYNEEFVSCLTTGKMDVPWSVTKINCPADSNLVEKLNEFESFSKSQLNINSDIIVNDVSISQSSSWTVTVKVNYTLKITDTYASWDETKSTSTEISIIGLRDPTYYIMSPSSDLWDVRYPMVIRSVNVPAGTWDEQPSTLHSIVKEGAYFSWQGAPSFLSRLDNKTMPSYFGIVSIVSPDFIDESLLAPGIKRSSEDFEFWKAKVINPADYVKYNFYNGLVNPGDYGIIPPQYGLNGTVINVTLATFTNMDDSDYLEVP